MTLNEQKPNEQQEPRGKMIILLKQIRKFDHNKFM